MSHVLLIYVLCLRGLKTADITPVHKKPKLDKSNYGVVNLLSNISNFFERGMHRQILEF